MMSQGGFKTARSVKFVNQYRQKHEEKIQRDIKIK